MTCSGFIGRGAVVLAMALAYLIAIGPVRSQAAVGFYNTRSSFNAAAPGLPVEGFSNGNVAAGQFVLQAAPLSSATSNNVFSSGSILPGLAVSNSGGNTPGLVVYGDGAVSGGTKCAGSNWFGDKLVLSFGSGVLAVGTDVFAATSPGVPLAGNFTVNVYNGSSMLGSTNVTVAKGSFGFVGVLSTTPVTSVTLLYTTNDASTFADNIAFGSPASSAPPPSILTGGVVPVYSSATTIQPGSWISIFGNNLASASTTWNNEFPVSLGGTSVTINDKPAYLWYVSPTQINLQAPDDNFAGNVNVVVTTGAGVSTSTVTLGKFGPSFSVLDARHVAGIILRSDGSGAYGGGTYDILGPGGTSLGYKTVAARAGDRLELFGVGFGPTNPAVPAGKTYSGSAQTTNSVQLSINNVTVLPTFTGISSAGLYQLNVVVPSGLGVGDLALQASVGGVRTPLGVVISLQ